MVSEITRELAAINAEGNTIAPAKRSVVQYTYGYLDKVLSVNRNGNETKFHYNADGMMVGKQHAAEQSVEPWIWDGLALAMKDGMTFASEAHISGGAAALATPVDGEVDDTRMLLNDHLGTTLAIFGKDAPGNVHTTSFGKALGSTSDTAMFTGKPYDKDLGAHVFAFRNYRSDLARWTSADPAGYPDGPNQQFYAPVPTSGLDPLGLESVTGEGSYTIEEGSGSFNFTATFDVTWDDVTFSSFNANGFTGINILVLSYSITTANHRITSKSHSDKTLASGETERTWTVNYSADVTLTVTLADLLIIKGITYTDTVTISDTATFVLTKE